MAAARACNAGDDVDVLPRVLRTILLASLIATHTFAAITPQSASRGARSRPVRTTPQLPDEPAVWLAAHATPLSTLERGKEYEFEPLLRLLHTHSIVGLGDTSHGTHEFYLWKARVIEMLVRELGFTTLALEAPAPYVSRLDDWVQGGSGDPVTLVRNDTYWFWNKEEVVDVLRWLREYNLTRGNRPAIRLTGVDPAVADTYIAEVTAYLDRVDPAAAAKARVSYHCFATTAGSADGCFAATTAIAEAISANGPLYSERSSPSEFERVLRSAKMLRQTAQIRVAGNRSHAVRDPFIAENVLASRTIFSSTPAKVIFWAHSLHVGKLPFRFDGYAEAESAGAVLERTSRYFAIGSTTSRGEYNAITQARSSYVVSPATIPEPSPGSYEFIFSAHAAEMTFIPLRAMNTPWVRQARPLTFLMASPVAVERALPIAAMYDAVFHIETTTPTRFLR